MIASCDSIKFLGDSEYQFKPEKKYERDGYAIVKNMVDKKVADEIKSHINWLVKKYPNARPEAFHHDMLVRDHFIHHLLQQKKF